MSRLKMSIIIPVLNEEILLPRLLNYLRLNDPDKHCEIIVVDANSEDNSLKIAEEKCDVVISTSIRSRAHQMNLGANAAKSKLLYFVHADVLPPSNFLKEVAENHEKGSKIGCFRQKFEGNRPLLRINAFFTRFDKIWCRGGDQTLFVCKELFDALGGFKEEYSIMEEYDFMKRAREIVPFKILKESTTVSIRKYRTNSWLKIQLVNSKAIRLFKKGVRPEEIREFYNKSLNPY
jgi:rSAM/selenodomain-associated transferase 2|tara:strand:+ start:57212 stop:57913 length:702 start_codon:yes stop_codon:yes gene_type:complete